MITIICKFNKVDTNSILHKPPSKKKYPILFGHECLIFRILNCLNLHSTTECCCVFDGIWCDIGFSVIAEPDLSSCDRNLAPISPSSDDARLDIYDRLRRTKVKTSNDLLVTFAGLYQAAHASSSPLAAAPPPPPMAQSQAAKNTISANIDQLSV